MKSPAASSASPSFSFLFPERKEHWIKNEKTKAFFNEETQRILKHFLVKNNFFPCYKRQLAMNKSRWFEATSIIDPLISFFPPPSPPPPEQNIHPCNNFVVFTLLLWVLFRKKGWRWWGKVHSRLHGQWHVSRYHPGGVSRSRRDSRA